MVIEVLFVQENSRELEWIVQQDTHVPRERLLRKAAQQELFGVLWEGQPVGWLRYGWFWDEIPFMNMLAVDEDYRGRGLGRRLVEEWEAAMKNAGCSMVMTSTLSDENAQGFYRHLGYADAGCLLLENEALEIIFTKKLR